MAYFKVNDPFNVRFKLYNRIKESSAGQQVISYEETDFEFLSSYKSMGGTDIVVDGVLTIEDTANLVTYYDSKIKAGCRLEEVSTGIMYEILGRPENYDMRNQFMGIRIRSLRG